MVAGQRAGAAEDAAWLESTVLARYGHAAIAGGDLPRWLAVYRRYFGFYFADSCAFDPLLYGWCLRQLRG